jgi:tRNA modification GTPase
VSSSYFSSDTIAAVATSLAGDAGVGIVRISGPRALAAANKVCRGLESPEARYLHRVEVVETPSGTVLDDGLAAYFPEGHSFTGEEVVELQLHGGRFLLQKALAALVDTGECRLALPGEFSFRAVRNGKLSLTGAEAIGRVIGARSLYEVQAARKHIGAGRTRDFDDIAKELRDILARCELSIDFIDQDVEVISRSDLISRLSAVSEKVDSLLLQLDAAWRLAQGIAVALVGRPNAGKSTLFNAILAEERAIVSAEAGTTRDVITEEIALGPYYVRLADTAGIREAQIAAERDGVRRSKALVDDADLVVHVVDVADIEPERISAAAVIALNKCDSLRRDEVERAVQRARDWTGGRPVVAVSAARGGGIGELMSAIRREIDQRYGLGAQSFLPSEFQVQMLRRCQEAVKGTEELARAKGLDQPELICAGIGSGLRALSDLVGETTPDSVLEKIFREFCIGK